MTRSEDIIGREMDQTDAPRGTAERQQTRSQRIGAEGLTGLGLRRIHSGKRSGVK